MTDYIIKAPKKPSLRHPKLLALKGVRVGPAWGDVTDPDLDLAPDHTLRRKTKSPIIPRKRSKYKAEREKRYRRSMRRAKLNVWEKEWTKYASA